MTKPFQSELLDGPGKLLSSLRIPRMSEDLIGRLGRRMDLEHLISKLSRSLISDVLIGHVSQNYDRESSGYKHGKRLI